MPEIIHAWAANRTSSVLVVAWNRCTDDQRAAFVTELIEAGAIVLGSDSRLPDEHSRVPDDETRPARWEW